MLISVIGGGQNHASAEALEMAEAVGQELALRGATVVCGGLGGVMEAVCRGAKVAGGVTIGILPGTDPSQANKWVDYPICTALGYARNVIVAKAGRAVIAIDGAYGTLSEIAHALSEGIPVIGLNTWTIARNGTPDKGIILATRPADAVEQAVEAATQRDKIGTR